MRNNTNLTQGAASSSPSNEWLQKLVQRLVLAIAFGVMVAITAWPHLLGSTSREMNHSAASLIMMGMSCGFVYGIGFQPRHVLWRRLFSAPVSLGLIAAGVLWTIAS